MCRLRSENNMQMAGVRCNGNNRTFCINQQRGNDFFEPVAYLVRQHFATIFHAPYQMVSEQISRMCAKLKFVFHIQGNNTTNLDNTAKSVYLFMFLCYYPIGIHPPPIPKRIGSELLPSDVKDQPVCMLGYLTSIYFIFIATVPLRTL